MKIYRYKFFAALTCFLLNTDMYAQSVQGYQKEIGDWHAERIKNLKEPNGWLNLVGLYWLEEGPNSFGSGPRNKIVFPAGTIVDEAGYFERSGDKVKLVVQHQAAITVNGKPVTEAIVFDKDSTRQPVLSCGNLRWTLIRRDDKIGIRLRDLASPAIKTFKDIERFSVDTSWRIEAVLQTAGAAQRIAIKNVLGQTSQQPTAGKLVFTVNHQQYSLDALDEGDELFVIFGDETNGQSTYPSGRFLYAKKPGADGKTILDFNKAYNPPCAFTNYATCPLPPKENILSFAITAGEKNYATH
jgi:uncharacterized protein (DUF1684 family)